MHAESDPVDQISDLGNGVVYVTGRHGSRKLDLLVARRTPTGWRSRSTLPDKFNDDYPNQVSFYKLCDWLKSEVSGFTLLHDREEVLAHLESSLWSQGSIGFLYPDLSRGEGPAAERVLQHLEREW
jgi:hypothetical protein